MMFALLLRRPTTWAIAVLLLALGIAVWRIDAISDQRETLRTDLAAERAGHAVTRASLAALQRELEQMVRDGELRAQRLAEARAEATEASEALRQQAARIRAQAGGDPCVTPDAVREAGL